VAVRLEGERLSGGWHLVRMRGRPGEKRNNWLLIKATDDGARKPKDKDVLEQYQTSVVTDRTMDEITEGKGKARVWHSNRTAKDADSGAKPAPKKRAAK